MKTARILHNNRIVEVQQTLYDLAIIHEHTNLAKNNTKKTIYEVLMRIRKRSKKYANLKLTAGVLYEGD